MLLGQLIVLFQELLNYYLCEYVNFLMHLDKKSYLKITIRTDILGRSVYERETEISKQCELAMKSKHT